MHQLNQALAGVAKFYLQQSCHMSNNFCEIMFNRKRYEALPDDLKIMLKYVNLVAGADMEWKSMRRMSQDYIELQTKQKITAYRTPKPILDAQLKAWDAVIKRRQADNPLFAKVIASQREWAKRVMYWHNDVQVYRRAGCAHHFGKGRLA